ncbi:MAG: phage holin family protein [Aerococcus sp.]|nr:phage holin family protein [Aerococcus sp.]
MLRFILQVILNALILTGLSELFYPHAYISSFWVACVLAVIVMGLFTFLLPILKVISFPLRLLTFGLFRIVLNGFLFMIANWLMGPAVYMESFGYMMLLATLYSIIQWGLQKLIDSY